MEHRQRQIARVAELQVDVVEDQFAEFRIEPSGLADDGGVEVVQGPPGAEFGACFEELIDEFDEAFLAGVHAVVDAEARECGFR